MVCIVLCTIIEPGYCSAQTGRKGRCMEQSTKTCIPEITLATDMMSAKMKLHLDESGQQFTVADLKEMLKLHNVKTGIMDATIQGMIEHDIYDVFVEVAKGKAPVKGADGRFVFHVKNPEEKSGPRELEDGSVEYVHTMEHTIVEEGDLLVEYIPPTNGECGYAVDNTVRTPMRGKGLPALRGKGFRIKENKYYAALHGRVEVTERGIYITNLLEVLGNVDISYGHINFDGDVNIRGDVKSGMMVKATGNIEIKGHVGSCLIEAGKNIIIYNGMQGKFSGKLKAGGSITCKFFENSMAEAGGDISVCSIMNSKLEAEGKITVEGRESIVLGGSIYAIQGMEISEAGNVSEVSTVLAAGVLPKIFSRDAELTHLIEKVEGEVDLLERSAKILERMLKAKATKEMDARRMEIIRAKVIKSVELKKYRDEKKRSEALINSGKNANIVVRNVIYPGCRIEIAGRGIDVKQQLKHVKFVLKDGAIEAALLY